jgi:hypothetical protein
MMKGSGAGSIPLTYGSGSMAHKYVVYCYFKHEISPLSVVFKEREKI